MKYILVLLLILFSLPAYAHHKNPGNDLFLRGYLDKVHRDLEEAKENSSCLDEYDTCEEVDVDEIEQDVEDLRNYTNLAYPISSED